MAAYSMDLRKLWGIDSALRNDRASLERHWSLYDTQST
jgi:hypothetical protein